MRPTPFTLLTMLLVTIAIFTSSCEKEIGGCMDPASVNYNPEATMDDGSCQYSGCTDPQSESYNPQATIDDGSCQYKGCTDPQSENYDPQATIDDGSCQYKGCTDPNSVNFNPQATIDDGSCAYERDPFIGTYDVAEDCILIDGSPGTFGWVMTISAATSDDVSEVNIWNLGDFGLNVKGIVDGDQLTISYDDGTNIIIGSGTLNGNKLTFSYTNSIPSQNLTESCEGVATKQ
ncbi:MAG: hypothetical protein KDD15_13300 [Lewinella sp.]|nr:hypothetical protein [Lewinella sp.]